jgi:hypothetical protein
MTKCYQKFNIPNFTDIQKEALDFFEVNTHLFRTDEEYFVHVPLGEFPLLKQFLESRAKIEINETSVYFITPGYKSKIHIDGLKKDNGKVPEGMMIAHQWVLILPLSGYENSVSSWYSNDDVSDEDERIYNHVRDQFPYNFYVSFVKDDVAPNVNPIETTNLAGPCFIKSNIYHDVHNNGPKTRMVFIIRFRELEPYESSDCVFNYQDLLI